MKNFKVLFGMSFVMFLLMMSCQKDLLPTPQSNNQTLNADSVKTLSISTDSAKQTLTLYTGQTTDNTKSSSLSVDWLKTFSANAGDHDFFILQSNTSWSIVSYPSWLTVSPLSGTGDTHVTVTVSANTGAQRTGVITIAGQGVTNNVTISALQIAGQSTQSSVSVDWLKTFSATAGDHDFFILTSNTSWRIESFPSWVTVSPLSGTGDAHVTVTVIQNTGAQRTGSITISGVGVPQTVSISALQLAGTPTTVAAPTPNAAQADYYLSPSGNDNNPGTIDKPFYSLQKLASVIQAGQLAYLRGGTYTISAQERIENMNGTANNMIKIYAYPGETPIITKSGNASISFALYFNNDNYVHLKGIEITGFHQTTSGEFASAFRAENCNYCIFEQLKYHDNGDPIVLGHNSTGNQFINCDSYHNYDPYTQGDPYGNADGYNFVTDAGTSNSMIGCRSWNNSDDGFDMFNSEGVMTFQNCWAFHQGYKEDEVTIGGDGSGFKIGLTSDYRNTLLRVYTNCVAYDNSQSGWDNNSANCIVHIFNCSAVKNAWGVDMSTNPANWIVQNTIAVDNRLGPFLNNHATFTENHNSWDAGYSVSDKDFVSMDYTQLADARKSDGSLPDITFLHLTSSSPLNNKGVDVGLTYSGSAPNLGAF